MVLQSPVDSLITGWTQSWIFRKCYKAEDTLQAQPQRQLSVGSGPSDACCMFLLLVTSIIVITTATTLAIILIQKIILPHNLVAM